MRLGELMQTLNPEGMPADWASFVWRWLAESRTVHLLCATPDGVVVECNDAVVVGLKRDRSTIIGGRLWECLVGPDAEWVRNWVVCGGKRGDEIRPLRFIDALGRPYVLRCLLAAGPQGLWLAGEPDPGLQRAPHGKAERLDERRLLAQGLHDTVSQSLTALALCLAGASQAACGSPPELRESLLESQTLAEQCGHEMRTLMRELRPALPESGRDRGQPAGRES